MSDYNYPQDNKVHTRYSELAGVGPGSVRRIVGQRYKVIPRFESKVMEFGTIRHELLAEEGLRTKKIASPFIKAYPELVEIEADLIENELAAEIFPDVILHCRPDVVSLHNRALIDYKTTVKDASAWSKSMQLKVYAYMVLICHKVVIKEAIFLIEQWDADRTKILGYDRHRVLLDYNDIMSSRSWLRYRAGLLKTGIKLYAKEFEDELERISQ